MKSTNIHTILTNITCMRLASEIVVNRTFEDITLREIVEEVNLYLADQNLPFRISRPGKGTVEYIKLAHERLDRVIYLLSWLIRDTRKNSKGVSN